MIIHRPKQISSHQGLGLNTTKTMRYINDDVAISTETWGTTEKPWAEGSTIIAQKGYQWRTKWETGKPYIITKFFDDLGNLVATYCDISKPVRRVRDGFEFEDMYLDIWQIAGEQPVVLDADELQKALEAGFISQSESTEANKNAELVIKLLNDQSSDLTLL